MRIKKNLTHLTENEVLNRAQNKLSENEVRIKHNIHCYRAFCFWCLRRDHFLLDKQESFYGI